MIDIFLFAILFALMFLVVHQESLTMLAFGLLGAMIGTSSSTMLAHRYVWWTQTLSLVLIAALFVLGCWSSRDTSQKTSLLGTFIASIGGAGLLTVILLPFLVSIFGHLPLSPYAPKLFFGTIPVLVWSLGAFAANVVASRLGR